MEMVYIRAEICGELPSGQKRVKILANNADGISFYTDEKCIIRPEHIGIKCNPWIPVTERTEPLTTSLSPIDDYKGLKRKFLVFKSDTAEMVEDCFVLRPDKDPAAVEALRAYARTTDNATLSADIVNWVGEGEERRWIPVTERLPDLIPCGAGSSYSEAVNVLTSGRKVLTAIRDGTDFIADADFWDAEGEDITHWTPVLLPLPDPQKEART